MKNSAHLLQLFPDGGGRVILMHSRSRAGTRLCHQHFKLWSKTLPIPENTWDVALAWKGMQTAFGGIRLEKHEWSQIIGIDSWHSVRLKRINTTLVSLTYFISAGSIKECVIHRVREEVRLRRLRCCRLGALFPVNRDTTWITGVSASANQTRQSVSSLCFSSAATSSENGSVLWVCCQLKSSVMTMYEDSIRSQRSIIPEAAWREPVCVLRSPSGLCCGLSSKSTSLYRCTTLYLSINLLIRLTCSLFERCPVFGSAGI